MKDKMIREGTRLFRLWKRSLRKDRDRWIKGALLAVLLLGILLLVRGCACGSKKPREVDEASQGVMTITVAPSPTPTEAPRQVDSSAVASSGNVTMVNEYLVQKNSSGGQSPSGTEAGEDAPLPEDAEDTGDTEDTEDTDGEEHQE
ncbi:MAG: hypothetical protein Q4D55_02285 [Eubacteriales bacterium]|nr:hypothetical protein [Eubacteriales bacterium]